MTETDTIARQIDVLRDELAAMRPLPPSVVAAIREPRDLELTYTSNAIEGNTLTLRETAEVIAHGVTISGKPLNDHLEAVGHHEALGWMYELAERDQPLTAHDVRQLHQVIMQRSKPDIAGKYAVAERVIAGSDVRFPSVPEIGPLMTDLGDWLRKAGHTPREAFDAHYRLVTIHPFQDGNGRTSRLLMNLMLVRGGYRPVPVRPADRAEYLDALDHAQLRGDLEPFQLLMHRRLHHTMADYAGVVREAVRHQERAEKEAETEEPRQGPSAAEIAQWASRHNHGRS